MIDHGMIDRKSSRYRFVNDPVEWEFRQSALLLWMATAYVCVNATLVSAKTRVSLAVTARLLEGCKGVSCKVKLIARKQSDDVSQSSKSSDSISTAAKAK